MKTDFSAFIAFPAQSCVLVPYHRPHRKSTDLEVDGSGKSTGFSQTVGSRIVYRSKVPDTPDLMCG